MRDFAKNYMNKPINTDGTFWANEDIVIGEADEYGNTAIFIDPAVTKNKVSDYTGIAVLSRGIKDGKDYIFVREAQGVKMSPQDLRERVALLIELYEPGVIHVETNQGGDLWKDVFKGLPAKYRSKHEKQSKQIRAGKALNYYQQGKIMHTAHFPMLEEQMWSFPKVNHDDVLDAVMGGILYFLDNKAEKFSFKQLSYIKG